jgi:hypothetical protein
MIGRALARHWTVPFAVVVIALAAFAVYRLQGTFGSDANSGTAGAMPDQIVPFNPKRVQLEVFGVPGASATITYLDVNATPQRVDTTLPWTYDDSTTVPAVLTNIQAQTDGSAVGCRIIIDGVVKVEQSSEGADAYVFCLDKSG